MSDDIINVEITQRDCFDIDISSGSGVYDHTKLQNIGNNTHDEIDTNLTRLANTSGTNTGDQDLSDLLKKDGSIPLDTGYEPSADLDIATKEYVDDNAGSGLPIDYINGGVASNNITTPDSIIDITALEARSSDNTTDISLSADSLDITADADWAGTKPSLASTTIHTWGTETAFKLDDATGSNITGAKREVAYLHTDSAGDIQADSITQVLPEPFETRISQGGETLWSGSAGVSTITLSKDINDYKLLEFTILSQTHKSTLTMTVETFKETTSTTDQRFIVSSAASDRLVDFYYNNNTSIVISEATLATLTKVVGIK